MRHYERKKINNKDEEDDDAIIRGIGYSIVFFKSV